MASEAAFQTRLPTQLCALDVYRFCKDPVALLLCLLCWLAVLSHRYLLDCSAVSMLPKCCGSLLPVIPRPGNCCLPLAEGRAPETLPLNFLSNNCLAARNSKNGPVPRERKTCLRENITCPPSLPWPASSQHSVQCRQGKLHTKPSTRDLPVLHRARKRKDYKGIRWLAPQRALLLPADIAESRQVTPMETSEVVQVETHTSTWEDARSASLPNLSALKKAIPQIVWYCRPGAQPKPQRCPRPWRAATLGGTYTCPRTTESCLHPVSHLLQDTHKGSEPL